MRDAKVVAIFCPRDPWGERLVLAAALGAVQAKAQIRIRRLPAEGAAGAIQNAVMDGEYIAPREVDAIWADAFLIAGPSEADIIWPELPAFFELLEGLRGRGKLNAVAISAVGGRDAPAGLTAIPVAVHADREAQARLHGHAIAEAARSLKPRPL